MTPTTNGVLFEWVYGALKPNLERGLKKAKLFTLAGCALLDDPNLCEEYYISLSLIHWPSKKRGLALEVRSECQCNSLCDSKARGTG
jgi:hypothetical protein